MRGIQKCPWPCGPLLSAVRYPRWERCCEGKIGANSESVRAADVDSLGSCSNSQGASPSATTDKVPSDSMCIWVWLNQAAEGKTWRLLNYGFLSKPKGCSNKS